MDAESKLSLLRLLLIRGHLGMSRSGLMDDDLRAHSKFRVSGVPRESASSSGNDKDPGSH